jgi:hypothetical protein
MIKLIDILKEDNKILVPRRSPEERQKNYAIATQKKIQQYIKDGSKGDLFLDNIPITSLPSGLNVGGDLNLHNTKITSLPSSLKVRGNLNLSNTPIASLPSDLNVGGYLDLSYTPITSLPSDLNVGWTLFLYNTPLSKKYSKEEIKQMVPEIKGSIYM